MHWEEAGVCEEINSGSIESLTVEPPQMRISGV
jgi:hypothetical protein